MNDYFVSCPFEVGHRVLRSRLQRHIVKCSKNYPGYETCPYNATHRVPEGTLKNHIQECASKDAFFSPKMSQDFKAAESLPKPIVQKKYLKETDPEHEIWDD